jgi:hypothetical protein
MRPINQTATAAGPLAPIPMDHYRDPFNVGLAVVLSPGASLTYTVEHTFDDVYAPGFNPALATWFPNTTLTGQTTSKDGNYAFPVTALRLNVTAFTSGTASFKVIQAGMSGE